MKNALKFLALGVAIAASATMAKADPIALGSGSLSVFAYGCDAVATTTSCPAAGVTGEPNAGGNATGLFFSTPTGSNPNPFLVSGSGSLAAFTGASFTGSSQYIPYTDPAGITLFTATATNGDVLVFQTTSVGQQGASVNGTSYDFSQYGNLNVYSGGVEISTSAGYVGVNPNGETFTVGLIAPTPEPGSLALLGTGLLGMAGIARRRFMKL